MNLVRRFVDPVLRWLRRLQSRRIHHCLVTCSNHTLICCTSPGAGAVTHRQDDLWLHLTGHKYLEFLPSGKKINKNLHLDLSWCTEFFFYFLLTTHIPLPDYHYYLILWINFITFVQPIYLCMAHEVEWTSSRQKVTGLIPCSSKDHVEVSLDKTLKPLFLLMSRLSPCMAAAAISVWMIYFIIYYFIRCIGGPNAKTHSWFACIWQKVQHVLKRHLLFFNGITTVHHHVKQDHCNRQMNQKCLQDSHRTKT